jgi:hypothetical protein
MTAHQRITVNLVLTGPFAGQTVTLNGYFFNKGVCTIRGQYDKIGGAITYFARCYQAYPEGSRELADAQARFGQDGGDHGNTDVNENSDNGEPEEIRGAIPTEQPGVATQPATDGGRNDNPPADSATQPPGQVDAEPALTNDKLVAAILSLDPANDDHWTGQGLPTMSAIEAAYGSTDITRKDVEEKLPGWNRTKAQAARE